MGKYSRRPSQRIHMHTCMYTYTQMHILFVRKGSKFTIFDAKSYTSYISCNVSYAVDRDITVISSTLLGKKSWS